MPRIAPSRRALLAALPAALAAPGIANAQAGAGRVVIIGGGFGGASAARFARDNFPALDVTLIEQSRTFTTCPYGNLVLAGRRNIESITFGYDRLAARGVRVVHQRAEAVDPQAKRVRLAD
ncbi:MAG: FAD-dependent oxidoreductase, partial [Rubritepida sp.]|nr:FAD-dependent oxidoreductase [Rubritepida sp.]